jgi:hypothetical protein
MLAAVLVRRIVDPRGDMVARMGPAAVGTIRERLLVCFEEEEDGMVLRKLCHVLAKASDGWSELMHRLAASLVSLTSCRNPH